MSTHSGNVAPSNGASSYKPHTPLRPTTPTFELSSHSSRTVRDSYWCSGDFMLGAGMVIFQDVTWKIVICYDTEKKYHFLPRGRKDLGETIDQTALREGWEESGYKPKHLPLYKNTSQPSPPAPPNDPKAPRLRDYPDVEPIMITTTHWRPRYVTETVEVDMVPSAQTHSRRQNGGLGEGDQVQKGASTAPLWLGPSAAKKIVTRRRLIDHGGEYLVSWFAGIIDEKAVRQEGTTMPDEVAYTSVLLSYEEVMELCKTGSFSYSEGRVVQFAVKLLVWNDEINQHREEKRRRERASSSRTTQRTTSQKSPDESTPSRASSQAVPTPNTSTSTAQSPGDTGVPTSEEEEEEEVAGEEAEVEDDWYYTNDDGAGVWEADVQDEEKEDPKGKGKLRTLL